jgi:putative transposase
MTPILPLLQNLPSTLNRTTLRQLSHIMIAMLMIPNRITMRGLSRWTNKGGSYRTIQRFFQTIIPWGQLFWCFFYHYLWQAEATYLLAGDESVITKSGSTTYGLDRFFSSIYGKPVPGLSFFVLSLINVAQRSSHPILVEQIIRPPKSQEKPVSPPAPATPKKRGRPPGSKNKNKQEVVLSLELLQIQGMIRQLMTFLGRTLRLTYLVLDGKYGHSVAAQMARQNGLHLISKLRYNSVLYFPYEGVQGLGAPRKYGEQVKFTKMPLAYLEESTVDEKKEVRTDIYQAKVLHADFALPLQLVVLLKTNLKNGQQSYVLLFSTDLTLVASQIIDYYSLRFQIEFNFREAKQFWGWEDFMNTTPTAVTNASNLSLFMVLVSQYLLPIFHTQQGEGHIEDLKSHYRGLRYVEETLKLLPQKPDPILKSQIFAQVSQLGRIYPTSFASIPI